MTAQETFGANFFETALTVEMAATDLTAVVASTSGLAVPCYVVLEPDIVARREVVLFDSSLTATTLVAGNINKRYLTGSAAGSGIVHPVGSVVRCSPLFQHFTDINDRVDGMIPKSIGTAQGDIIYFTASGTPVRLAKGTGLQYLRVNAGATAPEWATLGAAPTQAVLYTVHTWAIAGTIAVPSGDTDFLVPMFAAKGAAETVVLDKVRYVINSGTSVTFKMQTNGSDATGFTGISCTTTAATTDPADLTLADLDKLVPVVTAVSGTPKNMTITAYLKRTVTLA